MPALVPFVAERAPRAMVTTPDGLASNAAIALLHTGGNAADAAIGANAVLAVTAQHMCGMGGDLFALVKNGTRAPVGLNASGRAGSGADPDRLRASGAIQMPFRGDIRSVTVPGCVDGWCALHDRFGRLPLADVLAPAVEYARDGFPASPLLARAVPRIAGLGGAEDYDPGIATGARVVRPGLAEALAAIGGSGRSAWYEGAFGAGLLALGDGEYTPDDLRASHVDWVEPISITAWDHEIWTVPPNSQGYVTLASAWIADQLDLPQDAHDPQWAHLLIEAAKQAGHDRLAVLHEHADAAELLDRDRLEARVAAIDGRRASILSVPSAAGGTIHVNVVADGMAVSLTQSNCSGFGAHLAVPGVRVFLQNRGTGFSLDRGHPAEYGPRKRPPHTLCPTLVTRDDRARLVLGTMGADNQPMTLLQLLARLLHDHEDPAEAVAAGRFVLAAPSGETFSVWKEPSRVSVHLEAQAPSAWTDELARRGHVVEAIEAFAYVAGHAQVIALDEGELTGAADPRALIGRASGW